jgi:allophanate hydrolase subunit 2
MGARLAFDGAPFAPMVDVNIISESIVHGDIQIMGNGQPVVLLADRQPTGGYPRIACVISADLSKFVQLQPETEISFRLVGHEESTAALRAQNDAFALLPDRLVSQVRSASEMTDYLSTNLISGVVADEEQLPWD